MQLHITGAGTGGGASSEPTLLHRRMDVDAFSCLECVRATLTATSHHTHGRCRHEEPTRAPSGLTTAHGAAFANSALQVALVAAAARASGVPELMDGTLGHSVGYEPHFFLESCG